MKKALFKRVVVFLAIVLVLIQFFGIDKTNPAGDPSKDFMSLSNAPSDIASLLNKSCYDCHSNATVYPWYTNIAPVSWWLKDHVNEGREELNFSEWGNYSGRRQDHKLKEAIEQIEENEMPVASYTWMHSDSKLNSSEKEKLIAFFNSLRTHVSDKK
jgi:hypothetical protein